MKILHWLLGAAIAASLVTGAMADSQGSATGGTAGTQSTAAGCINQTPALAAGQQAALSCNSSGALSITGSFSATVAGFTPNGNYATPLSVTSTSGNVALPSGAVVLVQNAGSNVAYVNLGTSNAVTATASNIAVPALGGCSLTVGSNTYLAAITGSLTTTLNLAGGTGLANTCYGGGGTSGGGGGAVTLASGAVASGAYSSGSVASGAYASGSIAAGAIVDLGTGASPAANTVNARLATIATNTTNAGTPTLQSGSTTAVTQATAGNLNATVVGTGTFATQSTVTQSTASSLNATVVGTGTFAVQATGTLGTTGGWTPKLLNALSTTVVSVKASGGQLGMLQCYNPNSSQIYVQIFNIASGSVSLGSSTPLQSVAIAPTSTGGFALSPIGEEYGTAISVAVTTTATGSTAPSTAADCNAAYN